MLFRSLGGTRRGLLTPEGPAGAPSGSRAHDQLIVEKNRLNRIAVIELSDDGRTGRVVDTLTDPDLDVPTTVARYRDRLYLPNARFTTTPTPTTPYWVTALDLP